MKTTTTERIRLALWGFILAMVAVICIGAAVGAAPAEQYPPGYDYTCPAGTYPIGNGICKNEPTGCPFGDSVPLEYCTPPPDIKCSDNTWRNCWYVDNTTTPSAPQTTEPAKTTPTPNATQNPSNSTPNAPNTGNVAPSYTAPAANDATNVNETTKYVDVANANVNKNDDISPTIHDAPDVSEPADIDTNAIEKMGVAIIEIVLVLLVGATTVAIWVWAEARHPGFTRNGIDDLKSRIKNWYDNFTKRR